MVANGAAREAGVREFSAAEIAAGPAEGFDEAEYRLPAEVEVAYESGVVVSADGAAEG